MLKKFFSNSIFPFWFFHIPILPYFLYLSVRSRSLAFFTNVNPEIFSGGFINSSKIKVLKGVDAKYLPNSIYVSRKINPDKLQQKLIQKGITYPFILKPDKGERGLGVVKIDDYQKLIEQINTIQSKCIIQEFINYPLEFGILYYKNPLQDIGEIASITLKQIPNIIGDGKSTLRDLVIKKYGDTHFENIDVTNLDLVLEKDQFFYLEYIAHRNKRCVFKNYNHIYTKELLETFDKITSRIPNFHFGRFDVKANSIEDLISGKNLKILEINGVNSLPIHIFDPDYSFFQCYRDLHAHWRLIYKISVINTSLGFKRMKTRTLLKEIKNKYS